MKSACLKALVLATPWIIAGCGNGSYIVSEEDRPNILIAIGDDISFPHMGAYGTSWVKTPGFDRVAENGILFNNAFTPNAKSSPSRACLLTGLNSWQLKEAANHVPYFPQEFMSFIEVLHNNGYDAGYTAKGWAPGVANDKDGNPRQLTGRAFNERKTTPPTSGISGNDYAANFEEFLNSRDKEKPFCFWYGSTEPHRKYEYGSGISKGGKKTADIERVFSFWPDNEIVRTDMLDYAYEIEYFDTHLVRMLDMLEEAGELENTIVIVTSDNGMPFPRAKGHTYDISNHLPLAVMWPERIKNPGRYVLDFVSLIDIAPTILEAAGIDADESGMQEITGKSLINVFLSGKKAWVDEERNHVLIGRERNDVGRPGDVGYPVRGIIMDGFLYLSNYKPDRWPSGNPETGYLDTDGSPVKSLILDLQRSRESLDFWNYNFGKRPDEELYSLSKDPDCMNNLANDPGFNPAKRRLHEVMYLELLEQDDPRMYNNGNMFDKFLYADESVRNFYERFSEGELWRKDAGWVDSTDFGNR
jgi:arylsulfatase A-like enzyme